MALIIVKNIFLFLFGVGLMSMGLTALGMTTIQSMTTDQLNFISYMSTMWCGYMISKTVIEANKADRDEN